MRPALLILILFAAPVSAAPVPRERPADPLGRGYLGIFFTEQALAIDRVEPGTAAARAGLRPGDVFVRIGPLEPRERIQMQQLLINLRPGSRVLVTVRRSGELKTVVVQLGTRPTDIEYIPPPPSIIPP